MAVTPYGNVTAPAFTPYNPYSTPSNPYAPNPMAYNQPTNFMPTSQPTLPATATQPTIQQPMAVTPMQQDGNPFVLVPDRSVIKDAQIGRNQTVFFMNQNAPEFYAKSADNLGLCATKYYRFFEFDPEAEAQAAAQAQNQAGAQGLDTSMFMTQDQAEALITEKIEEAKEILMQLIPTAPAPKSNSAKPKAPKENTDA